MRTWLFRSSLLIYWKRIECLGLGSHLRSMIVRLVLLAVTGRLIDCFWSLLSPKILESCCVNCCYQPDHFGCKNFLRNLDRLVRFAWSAVAAFTVRPSQICRACSWHWPEQYVCFCYRCLLCCHVVVISVTYGAIADGSHAAAKSGGISSSSSSSWSTPHMIFLP